MCLPSQRAMLCLGPFKDDEDYSQKIKAYFQKEEIAKEDIERYMRKSKIDEYIEKRMLFNYRSKDKGSDEGKKIIINSLLSTAEAAPGQMLV